MLLLVLIAYAMPYGPAASAQITAAQADSSGVPVISLDEAIQRAEANEPTFAASVAEGRVSQLERSNARATLLPSATYHNQYLFTQGSGTQDRANQLTTGSSPRFIANNAVHEYTSQAVINETLGFAQIGAVRQADASAARAEAELEIARRGLVLTVVNLYFNLLASEARLASAQRAANEAERFVTLTQQREAARESAHADVVKAQIEEQQRKRDLADFKLAADKARLELAVLLYPDPRTAFDVHMGELPALPDRTTVEAEASANNPELKSALASLHLSEADLYAARAAYLPDLALNYTYGINAPQFAVNGLDGARNLGYSASATLDIPVWDWLSTERKVKQSQIRRDAAKVALSAAQKQAIANLAEFYDEAAIARDQTTSLDASVALAQESLRLTKLRYVGGEGTVLEVVDAQNALTSAEMARAEGTVRYRVALAQLQTLTGRP
ncbi:MAG TPA: TolC family protein [Silvibacterium sp.]|nr:TolC family protein [Silvibacterium sp.]